MKSERLAADRGLGGGACRRAVRVLAWALLFSAAAELGLVLGMEHWWPGLRDREYAAHRARVRARLAEKPGRPLLVVLGSSRTDLGFRPAALPPLPALPTRSGGNAEPVVVNCSLLGAGPVMELICLRRLLADGIHPDWVLLECWVPCFNNDDGDLPDAARFGWSDLPVVRRYHPNPDDICRRWLRARAGDWPSVGRALLGHYAAGLLPGEPPSRCGWRDLDPSGWLPCPERQDRPGQRTAHDTRALQELAARFFRDYHISAVCDRALHEILTLCRHKGIAVALVVMPESTNLRRCYPPAVRAQTDRYLRSLSQENGIPLLDARDWCPDEDFGDPVHLNRPGASAFTARFGREMLGPLLAGELSAGSR